jgi:hypothetical protein
MSFVDKYMSLLTHQRLEVPGLPPSVKLYPELHTRVISPGSLIFLGIWIRAITTSWLPRPVLALSWQCHVSQRLRPLHLTVPLVFALNFLGGAFGLGGLFVCFVVQGFELRDYTLSHSTSPFFFNFFIVLLFICAYKAWVISPPCSHPLPYHPLRPLPLPPTPSIPSRNYFALISNFVVERV